MMKQITQNYHKRRVRQLVTVLLALALVAVPVSGAFVDVPENAYYAESVTWATENGVTDGVSETRFAPDEPCTRAQIVSFLWKLEGRPTAQTDAAFTDVPPNSWYAEAVRWAVAERVTDGVSATEFAPDRLCTRAEGIAFLYKYYGREAVSGVLPFADVRHADWFYDAVLWGVLRGVVNGVSATAYAPDGVFTRAHIVTMLCRAETVAPTRAQTAVYLGVEGYGTVSDKAAMHHRFFLSGTEQTCTIPSDEQRYTLQNLLDEGGVYRVRLRDGVLLAAEPIEAQPLEVVPEGPVWQIRTEAGSARVTSAAARQGDSAVVTDEAVYLTSKALPYTPPVSGTPGRITVKNFLATALAPAGTTLYVYGGGWNWQDTAAATDCTTLGVAERWVQFFQSQDGGYTYKNQDAAHSYYPFHGWNQYGHLGLDCSGFVGWAVYNTVTPASGGSGYVTGAAQQAKLLADAGWGRCSVSVGQLRPGDVFSMRGHVWISLGTCADGSILILHSTPSASRAGNPGGGVQLSAIGSSTQCEAYRLADQYMAAYYPQWYARYPVALCAPATYTACVGHFTWSTGYDPDGYQTMTPAQILRDLFGN